MNTRPSWQPNRADLSRPSAARVYNYYLGGSSNFRVDREFAHRTMEIFPGVLEYARLNRLFLQRVVRFLCRRGIRQILDIGSGIPTVGSVHEVAGPESRVVYVDNEAVAIAHSELVVQNNANATIVQGDLREPERLLRTPELTELIDTSRPIGVLMLSMLHFVPDDQDPAGLIERYRKLLPAGSYLALSHGTDEDIPQISPAAALYADTATPATLRTRREVRSLLDGFDILEPGVVLAPEWRPDSPEELEGDPKSSGSYAAVGHIPQA